MKLVFDMCRYMAFSCFSLVLPRVKIVVPFGLAKMDLPRIFGCWVISFALMGSASIPGSFNGIRGVGCVLWLPSF